MTTKQKQASQPAPTSGQNTAGSVFCMTVDQSHSHDNSIQSSVSTISTFIDQITLEDKVVKKQKKIVKTTYRKIPANWAKTDINQLVALLKQHGSDFTLISTKMDKTRDQIKRKFKVLQKKYPSLAESIFSRQPNTECSNTSEIMIQQNDFFDQ